MSDSLPGFDDELKVRGSFLAPTYGRLVLRELIEGALQFGDSEFAKVPCVCDGEATTTYPKVHLPFPPFDVGKNQFSEINPWGVTGRRVRIAISVLVAVS